MVVTNWKEIRKEILIFWEGNFVLRKDRKGIFCFRKVEALFAGKASKISLQARDPPASRNIREAGVGGGVNCMKAKDCRI
jgi:hypothetical protein